MFLAIFISCAQNIISAFDVKCDKLGGLLHFYSCRYSCVSRVFIRSVRVCVCVCVRVCVIEEHDSSKARERSRDTAKLSESTLRSVTVQCVNCVLINH